MDVRTPVHLPVYCTQESERADDGLQVISIDRAMKLQRRGPDCGHRIMVITRASQARDAGSIPAVRSIFSTIPGRV